MIVPYNSNKFKGTLCKLAPEIPPEAAPIIWPEFIEKLGSPPSVLFPEFAMAFPLTIKAIEAHWPTQTMILSTTSLSDLAVFYYIALERVDLNLYFIDPRRIDLLFTEELFNERRAMMPTRWRELYRWFDSFTITDWPIGITVSKNTPFDHSSRLGFDGIKDRYPIKKADFKVFESAIGSNRMRCWLDTDAGDSLWLDETNCDHKVYHTKNGNLKDYFILPDPENILDEYLAHYVAGGKPADFNFRI